MEKVLTQSATVTNANVPDVNAFAFLIDCASFFALRSDRVLTRTTIVTIMRSASKTTADVGSAVVRMLVWWGGVTSEGLDFTPGRFDSDPLHRLQFYRDTGSDFSETGPDRLTGTHMPPP